MAKPTYRFTAITNLQVMRRDALTAKDVLVAVNEDILASEEVTIYDAIGVTGGSATLVQRTSGVNTSPTTVKRTNPRRINVGVLFKSVFSIDKLAAVYKQISF